MEREPISFDILGGYGSSASGASKSKRNTYIIFGIILAIAGYYYYYNSGNKSPNIQTPPQQTVDDFETYQDDSFF